jgi:HPt (histidine-containing phosphotransfer) domain-containing protein
MSPKPHDTDIYDRTLAAEIAGGNPKLASEFLGLLLEELPSQKGALKEAFAAGDLGKLQELNHKLLGSSRYCGTPALARATDNLERALADIPAEVVSQNFARVMEEIDRLLASGLTFLLPPE